MGRRVQYETPIDWHVFNRGSRRMALFRDESDASFFVSLLRTGVTESGCALWAYLLMSNHFHLALRGDSKQLQVCMQYVERLYAVYHNKRYGLSGAAFEGRYEAYPQGTLPMLLRTIAYIFMNPVAAWMVTRPEDYAWSNYTGYFGPESGEFVGDVDLLLDRVDGGSSKAIETLRVFMGRELVRIRRGGHRPGFSARDIQANHFDWLLEEAGTKSAERGPFDAITLAIYWAQMAGFHRGALAKVLGGPMSSTQRGKLLSLRRWIQDDPARRSLIELP